jgi:hypothetical protein
MANWTITDGDYYVDVYNGSDTNGGTASTPFATIQKAVDTATANQKIVIGSGVYEENLSGGGTTYNIYADGSVTLQGSDIGGDCISVFLSSKFYNINFENYNTFLIPSGSANTMQFHYCNFKNGVFGGDSAGAGVDIVNHCLFENIYFNTSFGGGAAFTPSDFVNNTLVGCTWVSSGSWQPRYGWGNMRDNIFVDHTGLSFYRGWEVYGVYDNNIYYWTGGGINIRVADSTSGNINETVYTDWATYQSSESFDQNSQNVDPQFNNPSIGDYTLSLGSPAENGGYVKNENGSRTRAISKNGLMPELISPTASYINVNVDGNGAFTLIDPNFDGTITSGEINLGTNRDLGYIRKYAFQSRPLENVDYTGTASIPDHQVYRMKYSSVPITSEPWVEFIWDTVPMVDASGYGNGSPTYSVATGDVISAKYVQLEITLKGTP